MVDGADLLAVMMEMKIADSSYGEVSAFYAACLYLRDETVKHIVSLLEKQDDFRSVLQHLLLQKQGKDEFTVFHYVCETGKVDLAKYFLSKAEPNIWEEMLTSPLKDEESPFTPLELAYNARKKEVVEAVIDIVQKKGDLFKRFLKFQHKDRPTLLHTACYERHVAVVQRIIDSVNTETAIELIRQTVKSENALHRAVGATTENVEVVTVLKDFLETHQQDLPKLLEEVDTDGETVFHYVCLYGYAEVAGLLWSSFSKDIIKKTNTNNETGLHYLCFQKAKSDKTQIGSFEKIIDMILKTPGKLTIDEIKEILNIKNESLGHTCIHGAFQSGNVHVIKAFSERVDLFELLEMKDENEQTCIHAACKAGQDEPLSHLFSLHDTSELIHLFAERDSSGQTALHLACMSENTADMVQVFVQHFLPYQMLHLLRIRDNEGNTPLHVGCCGGQALAVKNLIDSCELPKYMSDVLEIENNQQETMLHLSCANESVGPSILKHLSLLSLPVKRFNYLLCLKNASQHSALHVCIEQHSLSLTKQLLQLAAQKNCLEDILNPKDPKDDDANPKNSPILFALENDDASVLKLLLENANDCKILKEVLTIKSLDIFEKVKSEECKNTVIEYAKLIDESQTKSDQFRMLQDKNGKPRLDVLKKVKEKGMDTESYFKKFISTYWKESKSIRYILYCILTIYVMLMIFFTLYVMGHSYSKVSNVTMSAANDTVAVVQADSQLDLAFRSWPCVPVFRIFFGVFAGLVFMFDIAFLVAVFRTHPDSYGYRVCLYMYNLVVSISCLVLLFASICQDYNNWQHAFGTLVMILIYIRLAFYVTVIPSDNQFINYFSAKFLLSFRIIWQVLKYLPVFAFFGTTFALSFMCLFQVPEQVAFYNFGYALLKTLAMAIGEFDLGDLVLQEEDVYFPYHVFACILLAVFMLVMTISLMNLLIAIAFDELQKLDQESSTMAFSNVLGIIQEVEHIISWFPCSLKLNQ